MQDSIQEKFNDYSIDENTNSDEIPILSLEELKKKYPMAKITMKPLSRKFPGSYFARVDIIKQNGEEKYLGALKGPIKQKDALEFFNRILFKEYNKFY